MDALEFLMERKRLCGSYRGCPDFVDKAQDDLETFYGRRADNV